MNVIIVSLISGFLLWPVVGSAQLYKWTDEQGNLHFTDTPPPEPQKKSAPTAMPAPRSPMQKKSAGVLNGSEQHHAQVPSTPGAMGLSSVPNELDVQPSTGGLSPNQATLTSSWQTFEGAQGNAKAPVQRWKDEQGLEHFGDAVPVVKGSAEMATMSEDVSVSRAAIGVKKRTTAASRTRHHTAE